MNRPPAVAGSFYPADPQVLQTMVDDFLSEVDVVSALPPKVIIAPHAGYIYSGPVAASAYARLRGARERISRVVLIGPSHRVAFRGLALSTAQHFLTPLGTMAVDQDAAARLAALPFVGYLDQAHALEHSLEVHLPFLQRVLGTFLLTPIVAGDATPDEVCQVISALWGGDETLLVISSDLSHYHDYATAQRMDQQTSQAIEALRYEAISPAAACGKVAVCGLLKWLRDQAMAIKVIDLRNSGDTAGDKHRVVGYGSYVVE